MLRRLVWLAVLLACAAALAAFTALRSYRAFTREELVAAVRCEPAAAVTGYRFHLKLRQVRGGEEGPEQSFPMHGEQWTVGGEILKWSPLLTSLGARPCHKLTRVSSRYLAARQEARGPRSAYDLNGGSAWLWRWLHRFGASLPLVDAVYGNAVYTDARPGARWGVYVTHSGYLIRPLPAEPV